MNITGLYRVQVSEKYRFLPQCFNFIKRKVIVKKTLVLFWTRRDQVDKTAERGITSPHTAKLHENLE